MRKLILCVIVVSLMLVFTGCTTDDNSNNVSTSTYSETDSSSEEPIETSSEPDIESKAPEEISFDTVIDFKHLDITLGSKIEFINSNNTEVIKIPITVYNKTLLTSSLKPSQYRVFGPDGLSLETLNQYFDDNIDSVGAMRTKATANSYLYIPYKGNGNYYVEFITGLGIEVKLPITK